MSGTSYKGVRERPDDPWQNTGFGLYMASRLCQSGGDFIIESGSARVKLTRKKKELACGAHTGTAIRMNLFTRNLAKLSTQLSRFNAEGSEQAREIRGVRTLTASKASQMLAEHFKK